MAGKIAQKTYLGLLKDKYSKGVILEAGIDEAGRGCLAGPVVAAAVVWPIGFHHQLIRDSKQLSATERNTAKTIILEHALQWSIGISTPQEIDQFNILNATYLAMHRAIAQLNPLPGMLLVDGNRFKPYPFIPHQCIIKGDNQYLSIAAASILAKTHRDQLMAELSAEYPQYHWHDNKGYPTAYHFRSIKQFGTTPHHRMSFLKSFA